jgi:hypothetical protein
MNYAKNCKTIAPSLGKRGGEQGENKIKPLFFPRFVK